MAAAEKLYQLPVVLEDLGRASVEARHELGPDLESPAMARRWVRETLAAANREAWIDTAELLVSEVVTNAALHAHTSIELWLGVYEDRVWVEVRDFNPVVPVRRDYDLEATTGRGLGLVSRLARSCGVHGLGEHGKVVWFCVAEDPTELSADELIASWDIDELLDGVTEAHDVTLVELGSLPATLWLSAQQHHDAMVREFVLYHAGHSEMPLDIASADAARSLVSTAVREALEEAHAAGKTEPALPDGHPSPLPWVPRQLDLRIAVPLDAASLFATLQDVLDAAERLAVEEKLLIRPGLPEIIAVRDWACEEVISQLAGSTPAAWPGTDQEQFEEAVHAGLAPVPPQWDASVVTEADLGVIAADDANRIIAISQPLAAALLWEPEDLVGRRVVSVIPPALREAHVAGFSRHLNTGEAHVLGVPLDLPVLRKDGSELRCRFLVERAPANDGRAVYLAWIEPLEEQPSAAGAAAPDGRAPGSS
ncbi:MAG: PAS domain S-box protein [Actinobacteria bacterium]|nr:PAS domain S-box protein [Actinomycetota bacterium]